MGTITFIGWGGIGQEGFVLHAGNMEWRLYNSTCRRCWSSPLLDIRAECGSPASHWGAPHIVHEHFESLHIIQGEYYRSSGTPGLMELSPVTLLFIGVIVVGLPHNNTVGWVRLV